MYYKKGKQTRGSSNSFVTSLLNSLINICTVTEPKTRLDSKKPRTVPAALGLFSPSTQIICLHFILVEVTSIIQLFKILQHNSYFMSQVHWFVSDYKFNLGSQSTWVRLAVFHPFLRKNLLH